MDIVFYGFPKGNIIVKILIGRNSCVRDLNKSI